MTNSIDLLVTCPNCEHTHTIELDEDQLLPNKSEERLYKLKDLETMLGLARRTLKRHIYDGRLRAFKPGRDRRWHVRERDLRAFRQWRGE